MATSFAAYASQYLNRQVQGASSASSSSQPMFFSFTTDEGSRVGPEDMRDRDLDIDDEGDPHLRYSDEMRHISSVHPADDEDPYLRLDEDDGPPDQISRRRMDNLPLISPESSPLEDEHRHGWLVHQTMYTAMNPSPRSSSDSSSSSSSPPAYLRTGDAIPVQPQPQLQYGTNLTESLLPRDGQSRPVDIFSLPDPRRLGHGRRMYKDSIWTSLWCFSISACYIASILILFTTSKPTTPKGTILPYTTLIHTIPLITVLTFVTAIVSYAHILLLRMFIQPVLFATSVFVPVALFVSSLWAFIGSFMWEEGTDPTWGETVGLRLFAIIPLVLGLITSRRLLTLPQEIRTTSAVLSLATNTLMLNPFLLALSPFTLLVSLIASIPFLTLIFRLTLIGYALNPFPKRTAWEWHISEWAGWGIAGTIFVWLWSWAVARGVLRMTCSAVIGAWYFNPPHVPQPPPTSTYRIHAALHRSANMSLGTVVVSALLLAGVRFLGLLTTLLRRAPVPLLPLLSLPLNILGNATNSLSTYALAYAGLTGDSFFPSARRARALAAATHGVRDRFRRSGRDSSLAILTVTPLTLTLPFALIAYLFVAHTLSAPDYAAGAALLAGGVTALVGLFCVGLVEDAADALYMCYCIDRDIGKVHQSSVFEVYEGRLSLPPEVVPVSEPEINRPPNQSMSPLHKNHQGVIAAQPPGINNSSSASRTETFHPSPSIPQPVANSYISSSTQLPQNPATSASHVSMSRSAGLSEALSEDSQILPGSDFFA